jgi:hypothetical protein
MKKYLFLTALIFLTISLFAQNDINYDKILKGDLSDFVGYWVNGNNRRMYIQSDTFGNFKKWDDGIYSWNGGNHAVWILPVGVETPYCKSDTTRVRLHSGQDAPGAPEDFYYRETEFPATHIVEENLRLRTDQNLSSSTLKILEKGAKVLVQEWGNDVTIDGSSARWALVFTGDGFIGWCYSGNLKEL